METNHEKGAIGHFAREFDHARPRRKQVHWRRCRAAVAQADRCRAELHLPASKEPAEIADRVTHEGHARAQMPDAPRRDETWGHGEICPPGRDFLQTVGKRGENQRMPNHGARSGREELQPVRRLSGQGQRQIDIPATGRMIVNAYAVEASVLAAGDECSNLGQRPAGRNAQRDAEPGQSKPPIRLAPAARADGFPRK